MMKYKIQITYKKNTKHTIEIQPLGDVINVPSNLNLYSQVS